MKWQVMIDSHGRVAVMLNFDVFEPFFSPQN